MAAIHDTAYPRFRSSITTRELREVYTPSRDELLLATQTTRGTRAKICFLVLLKTFQRLGYFVPLIQVPPQVVRHIARAVGQQRELTNLAAYDRSGTRLRHIVAIRAHLGVTP